MKGLSRLVKYIFEPEDFVVATVGSYSFSWDGPQWNAPYHNEIQHKTMRDLKLYACHHNHRTIEAAEQCGCRLLRQIKREFIVVAYEEGSISGLQLVHKTTPIRIGDVLQKW